MQYTPAELDVIQLVHAGLSNAEIAQVLGRSMSTVKNQLNSLYKKHDVVNRAELKDACASGTLGVDDRARPYRHHRAL
jgi:DNA-binding NarL/FixJ family response regulator